MLRARLFLTKQRDHACTSLQLYVHCGVRCVECLCLLSRLRIGLGLRTLFVRGTLFDPQSEKAVRAKATAQPLSAWECRNRRFA